MKSVLIIGLGRFGRHIAMKLNDLNHQVMAVDTNEERVNAVLPFVTNAQIGDSTNEEFLSNYAILHVAPVDFDILFALLITSFVTFTPSRYTSPVPPIGISDKTSLMPAFTAA